MPTIEITIPRARKATKIAANLLVSLGTWKITTTVIENNVDTDEEKLHDRAAIYVGSAALASMVADHTSSWTDRKVDDFFDSIERVADVVTGTSRS